VGDQETELLGLTASAAPTTKSLKCVSATECRNRHSAFITHRDKPVVLDPSVKLASIRENYLLVTVAFLFPSAEEERC
jgi:hypothetical protein